MVRRILSPITTVVGLTIVAVATIVLGTTLMVVVRIRPESRIPEALARLWSRIFLAVTLTPSSIDGLEHVDPSTSYVVVSNHMSNLDPPFHIAHLPIPIRFLAKKELFRIPVFGQAMRAYGIIETDRQAHAAAHRAINEQVARQVARGKSLIIYPEGTRSDDGRLRPFKKGAFRIAIDNAMPILPVAITGTHAAWPPGSKLIRGGRARALVGEPIPVDGLDSSDISDLRDRAHAEVDRLLEELGHRVSRR
ncbi:MAG: lysophospholipid acyltransferase family protein [Acidimicrobiia bacterium]|nr:lysophospholipid acyltransferase family protein [Acidimicrobiia bacterium]